MGTQAPREHPDLQDKFDGQVVVENEGDWFDDGEGEVSDKRAEEAIELKDDPGHTLGTKIDPTAEDIAADILGDAEATTEVQAAVMLQASWIC